MVKGCFKNIYVEECICILSPNFSIILYYPKRNVHKKIEGNQAASMLTGKWNSLDFIYLMLISTIRLKVSPKIDWMVMIFIF